jgi:hypothetical protein
VVFLAIDRNSAMNEYKNRTAGAAQKLVDKYTATSGKLAKASSDSAQKAYIAGVSDPKAQARRQQNLRKLNEEDLNAAMRAKGGAAYSTGTQAGADKWSKNVEPYLQTIESTVAGLPERTRDVTQNVTNRVLPIAKALNAKKNSQA